MMMHLKSDIVLINHIPRSGLRIHLCDKGLCPVQLVGVDISFALIIKVHTQTNRECCLFGHIRKLF